MKIDKFYLVHTKIMFLYRIKPQKYKFASIEVELVDNTITSAFNLSKDIEDENEVYDRMIIRLVKKHLISK